MVFLNFSSRCFNPNITIRADNAPNAGAFEKFKHVVLHATNVVVVYFDKDAVLEQAVLLIASLDLNSPVEASNLLDFGDNQVALHEMFSHVKFVFLKLPALNASW